MLRPAALLLPPLLCLALSCAAEDSPVELKLHWEPGVTYIQESDTDTTNFLTALGKTTDQKMRLHPVS